MGNYALDPPQTACERDRGLPPHGWCPACRVCAEARFSGFYEHSRRRYFVFKFLSGDAAAGSERPLDDCEGLSFDKRVALPRRRGTGYSINAGL